MPGGFVGETMCDSATLAFLAGRGAKASYVTSVCNGSLVLAAAELLDGYRSATHWAARGHLAQLGVEVSTERVCIDRNTISGGGVTAGIDFGLTIVAHVFGDDVVRFCQLAAEYDPKPPFDAGSPEKAGRSRRRPRRGRPDFPQAHEPPLLELVATALSGHVTR
ncbi:DJ-1/PfpI family protein [Streptomyces malaysiensis]|uniref:DJ-1/PfpI family protein n=1 Tax=Streptomyces malaysiensis TaxID=92644 RepID=UPI00322027FC